MDSFYYGFHSTGMRHPSPSAEQGMLHTALISLLVLQWGSTALRQGTTDPEMVTGFSLLNTEGKHSLCLHKWLTKAASHSLNKQLLQSQHMLTSPRCPAKLLWPWYIPSRSRPTWPEAGCGPEDL